jgi:hypothetical protein
MIVAAFNRSKSHDGLPRSRHGGWRCALPGVDIAYARTVQLVDVVEVAKHGKSNGTIKTNCRSPITSTALLHHK